MTTPAQRISATPQAPPPTRLLQRACACGGKAGPGGACASCQRHKRPWQAKWRVNRPGDHWEQEADRVSALVMGSPAPGGAALPPPAGATPPAREAPDPIERALHTTGRPLHPTDRQWMETRFGYNFGQVRIHADATSAAAAEAVQAQAFTLGSDIVFGGRQYAPATVAGRHLLAHELTHVVQQGAATPRRAGAGATAIQTSLTPAVAPRTLQRRLVNEPAGGCGLCHGPRQAGTIAHTLIQQEFELIRPLGLVELPVSSPTDHENGRLDLAVATPTGFLIGEIKPANTDGMTRGASDILFYEKAIKAAFPGRSVGKLSIPIPAPPAPFPNPQVPACPPQSLSINRPVNGVYGYFCLPPFSRLVPNPACRCGPPPVPVPVPERVRVPVWEKVKNFLRQTVDVLADVGKVVAIAVAIVAAAVLIAKRAAVAAAAAKFLALAAGVAAALALVFGLGEGEAQAAPKPEAGGSGSAGTPKPEAGQGAPTPAPTPQPGAGQGKTPTPQPGPAGPQGEAQPQPEATPGGKAPAGRGRPEDRTFLDDVGEFVDEMLQRLGGQLRLDPDALRRLIVLVDEAEKAVRLAPGGDLLALLLKKLGDFLRGLLPPADQPPAAGRTPPAGSGQKADGQLQPPSGGAGPQPEGQQPQPPTPDAGTEPAPEPPAETPAPPPPPPGKEEQPPAGGATTPPGKTPPAGAGKSGAGASGGGSVGATGKDATWPVIFEELEGVGFSVHPAPSHDNGSGSIMLPDNPKAILHFKAPDSLVIVNSTSGAEEGVAKPSSIGKGWYELVSGPLYNRLKSQLNPWFRQNRSRALAAEIANDLDKYPRRLHFQVTYEVIP